jgi:DNA-binding GntR family transcriptional regulator
MGELKVVGQLDGRIDLPTKVYRELEEEIVMLRMQPGQSFSVLGLSERFDVERLNVREALRRLEKEGLIFPYQHDSGMVTKIDVRQCMILLHERRTVECRMVRLATQRATPAEAAIFATIANLMWTTVHMKDAAAFMQLDFEFNALLGTVARDDFSRRAMGCLNGLYRRYWYMHYLKSRDLNRGADLHAELSMSIAQGDAERASAACGKLIDYLEATMAETFEPLL